MCGYITCRTLRVVGEQWQRGRHSLAEVKEGFREPWISPQELQRTGETAIVMQTPLHLHLIHLVYGRYNVINCLYLLSADNRRC